MNTVPRQLTVPTNGIELAALEYGDPNAPLVLLLHGFPDSPMGLRHLARHLAEAGYRVVTPWLRGFPPSPLVNDTYQSAAIAHDAIGMARTLSPEAPCVLIGHDWGGVATYGAAVLGPAHFQSVVVMSVPPTRIFRPFLRRDPDQQRASWYQFLFQLETVAETTVSHDDFAFIERLWRDWAPGWPLDRIALESARSAIREGFPASILYYRDAWQPARQSRLLVQDQQRIVDGPIEIPSLVLYGLQDGCVLPEAYADMDDYFAAEHHIEALDGIGHFPHMEDPARVSARILAFLTGASARPLQERPARLRGVG